MTIESNVEGVVSWFNDTKGYGFIKPVAEHPKSAHFIHIRHLEKSGLTTLSEGQRVIYDIEQGNYGKEYATNVRIVVNDPSVEGYIPFSEEDDE